MSKQQLSSCRTRAGPYRAATPRDTSGVEGIDTAGAHAAPTIDSATLATALAPSIANPWEEVKMSNENEGGGGGVLEDMSNNAVRAELVQRGLSPSGVRDIIMPRLREARISNSDAVAAQPQHQPQPQPPGSPTRTATAGASTSAHSVLVLLRRKRREARRSTTRAVTG
jgi:hypothetical protein